MHRVFFLYRQVLNLFLALLLNAFDNGDDDEEGDDNENEEPLYKQCLSKLTQTKKTAVFPFTDSQYREDIYSSSQEIQAIGREREGRNSTKTSAGECVITSARTLDNFSLKRQQKSK